MKKIFFIVVLLFSLFILSCNLFNSSNNDNPTINSPIIANVEDAFSYVVDAVNFSDSLYNELNFQNDQTVFTYTTIGYDGGSVRITVFDSDTTQIYQDTITSNEVVAQELQTKPKFIEIVLKNFDGLFELALARDN